MNSPHILERGWIHSDVHWGLRIWLLTHGLAFPPSFASFSLGVSSFKMSRGPLRRLFPRGVKRLSQVLHNHLRLALGLRGARGLLPGRRDRAFKSEKSGGASAEGSKPK